MAFYLKKKKYWDLLMPKHLQTFWANLLLRQLRVRNLLKKNSFLENFMKHSLCSSWNYSKRNYLNYLAAIHIINRASALNTKKNLDNLSEFLRWNLSNYRIKKNFALKFWQNCRNKKANLVFFTCKN